MTRRLLLSALYLTALVLMAWIVLPLNAWQDGEAAPEAISTTVDAPAAKALALGAPLASTVNRSTGMSIRLYKLDDMTPIATKSNG